MKYNVIALPKASRNPSWGIFYNEYTNHYLCTCVHGNKSGELTLEWDNSMIEVTPGTIRKVIKTYSKVDIPDNVVLEITPCMPLYVIEKLNRELLQNKIIVIGTWRSSTVCSNINNSGKLLVIPSRDWLDYDQTVDANTMKKGRILEVEPGSIPTLLTNKVEVENTLTSICNAVMDSKEKSTGHHQWEVTVNNNTYNLVFYKTDKRFIITQDKTRILDYGRIKYNSIIDYYYTKLISALNSNTTARNVLEILLKTLESGTEKLNNYTLSNNPVFLIKYYGNVYRVEITNSNGKILISEYTTKNTVIFNGIPTEDQEWLDLVMEEIVKITRVKYTNKIVGLPEF